MRMTAQSNSLKIQEIVAKYGSVPDMSDTNIKTVGTRSPYGDHIIHLACVAGELKDVEFLLDTGININTKGEDGYTPLHYAAEQGHVNLVRLLIKKGANLSIRDDAGETAADLAEVLGDVQMKMLLKN